MKIVKKIAIIIAVILLALIGLGVFTGVSEHNALDDLKTAPASSLSPMGELAEIFAFGTDYTDIQRENKLKEIKGSVVAWQLPVFEVKRDGNNYRILTQNIKGLGGSDAMVPTIITLTPLSEGDRLSIEALKTGDFVAFKGVIEDAKLRHLLIKPAYLDDNPPLVKLENPPEYDEVANPETAIEASPEQPAAPIAPADVTSTDRKPSSDCSKASTSVEKSICNEPYLGKLDGALVDNFKLMKSAKIGDGALADLNATQILWLEMRNSCTDSQCLVEAYKARIDQVCEYPVISGVHPACVSADEVN